MMQSLARRILTYSPSLTLILHNAQRSLILIRAQSSSAGSDNGGNGSKKSGFFDRLLPEDPPELKEYKARESRLIRAQMGRSKFMDAHRANGADKLFVATGDLSAPTANAVFPEIELEPIIGSGSAAPSSEVFSRSRATVVTIAFQGMGQAQLIPWHAALSREANTYQLVNVLFLQGWLWRMSSARDSDHFCDGLQIHNRMMAHVFILDAHGAIRWRAHGSPAKGEIEALLFAVSTLASTPQRGEFMGNPKPIKAR